MPNPRGSVDYTDIAAVRASYLADGADIVYSPTAPGGSAVVGRAVMVSGHKTVRLCGDGDPVEGRLEKVEADGVCTVMSGGYAELPGGDGAALTPGRPVVGALGAGGARGFVREVPAAGGAYGQAAAAAAGVGRGSIVDASDAAAVVVRL